MSSIPEPTESAPKPLRVVGRYALYGKLATGGMATVHFGRLLGPVGFSRTVAIKRLHPEFAKDPDFVTMFLDEARVAARIQHPNVVATVDIVSLDEELFLVMDYVRGESFSRLLRTAGKKGLEVPEGFIGSIMAGMLHGLHAAHEATDERGKPLKVVHRDVSPQNVLVGVDGVARVLDFGVAKAAARVQVTREGQMKGKLSYMSPEQLQAQHVDRRSDIFAAGVVLWEALTGQRLFTGDEAREVLVKILTQQPPAPSRVNPNVRPELDSLVKRALEKDPDHRFQTAREFAIAVEECMQLLSARETGEWVEEIAGDSLERREAALAEIESISSVSELSAITSSDAGFVKTLSRTLPGSPVQPRSWRGPAPPPKPSRREPSRRERVPSSSRRRAAPPPLPKAKSGAAEAKNDEEATRVYDPDVPVSPANPPATDPQAAPLPFELTDDPTQIYDPMAVGDVTSPKHPSTSPPPGQDRRRLYVAAAVLVASVAGGALAARAISSDEPVDAASPQGSPSLSAEPLLGAPPVQEPAGAPIAASADSEKEPAKASATAPIDSETLPKQASSADGAKQRSTAKSGSSRKIAPKRTQRSVSKRSQRPAAAKKPSSQKSSDCSRPFYIDKKGIRRIKPACL